MTSILVAGPRNSGTNEETLVGEQLQIQSLLFYLVPVRIVGKVSKIAKENLLCEFRCKDGAKGLGNEAQRAMYTGLMDASFKKVLLKGPVNVEAVACQISLVAPDKWFVIELDGIYSSCCVSDSAASAR